MPIHPTNVGVEHVHDGMHEPPRLALGAVAGGDAKVGIVRNRHVAPVAVGGHVEEGRGIDQSLISYTN